MTGGGGKEQLFPLVAEVLTCNEGTCVVFGCLDFCFCESGSVCRELSIIEPVSSQNSINAVIAGTLETYRHTHKHVLKQTNNKNNATFSKRDF